MCSLNIISRASNRRERVSPGGHGEAYRGSSARSAVFESARLTLKPPPEIATISTIVEARVRASARRGRETGGGSCLVSALSKAILAGERDTTAARLLRPRLYFSPPIPRALLRDPIFRHTFQSRFDRPPRHMRVHPRGSVGRLRNTIGEIATGLRSRGDVSSLAASQAIAKVKANDATSSAAASCRRMTRTKTQVAAVPGALAPRLISRTIATFAAPSCSKSSSRNSTLIRSPARAPGTSSQ